MWIAVFGGLSPLRGPLATASAESKNSKPALDGAMAPAQVRRSPSEGKGVWNTKSQVWRNCILPPVSKEVSCVMSRRKQLQFDP
jgi:hypothetical protein